MQGTPGNEVNPPDRGDENQNIKKDLDCDVNHADRTAPSAVMGPPRQLERASSLRKPLRQGVVASVVTTHTQNANTPRTHDGNLPRPQSVSIGAASVKQRPQSTDKVEATRNSTVETLAKPRASLHSRSQSVGGPTTPQVRRQEYAFGPRRDMLASSRAVMPPKSLEASGQGQTTSEKPKVTASKPQFSTYQQHFSPKKVSKTSAPPMSGGRNDQRCSANAVSEATKTYSRLADETGGLQAQTSRLQDELLQLQLMYDSSHCQQKKYLQNIMQKFEVQFAALSRDHRALTSQEHAYDTRSNCAALQQWLGEGDMTGPGKLQTLARCIQEVATLTAPEGKLCMAMEQFEAWFERMIVTSNSRTSGTALPENHDVLVSPLGKEWHDLVAVLHSKLDHCDRVLHSLGSATEGSGVAMVLDAHKMLVGNLRQELVFSSAIENMALQQEQIWIDESIAKMMHEDDAIGVDCQRDGLKLGAWNVDMT